MFQAQKNEVIGKSLERNIGAAAQLCSTQSVCNSTISLVITTRLGAITARVCRAPRLPDRNFRAFFAIITTQIITNYFLFGVGM